MRYLALALLLIAAPAAADEPLARRIATLTQGHAIVAIGENHRSQASHAFVQMLLHDSDFICGFDDVVLEYGNRGLQETADRFVAGAAVSLAEKRPMWSDTTQFLIWDSPLYEAVYDTIRAINLEKRCPKPIRILLGDPPIRWAAVATADDYRRYAERDESYAQVIETEILAKHRRGLFLTGVAHVGKGRPAEYQGRAVAGELIERRHPGIFYSITPVSDPAMAAKAGLTRPLDFIAFAGTPKAEMSFGNFVSGAASMRVPVNGVPTWVPTDRLSWPKTTAITDALIYLPAAADDKVPADTAIYADPTYRAELARRAAILSAFYGMDFTPQLEEALRTGG